MSVLATILKAIVKLVLNGEEKLDEERKQTAELIKQTALLQEIRDRLTVEQATGVEVPEGPVVEQP